MGVEKVRIFGRGGIEFAPSGEDPLGNEYIDEFIFGPTIGFGLHYKAVGINFMLDYAWRKVDYFDDNSVLSLKFGF